MQGIKAAVDSILLTICEKKRTKLSNNVEISGKQAKGEFKNERNFEF